MGKAKTIGEILDSLDRHQKDAFWRQIHTAEDLSTLNEEQRALFDHMMNLAHAGVHHVNNWDIVVFDEPVDAETHGKFFASLSPEQRRYFNVKSLEARQQGKDDRLEEMFKGEQRVIFERLLNESYKAGLESGL